MSAKKKAATTKTGAFELLEMRCSIFEQRAHAAEEKYNKAWSELGAVGPELAETKKQLAEANAAIDAANVLLAKGRETMREHAGVVVELNEALAAKNKELVELSQKLAALAGEHLRAIHNMVDDHRKFRAEESAEIAYWMGEVTRLHHELLEIKRDQARAKAS